MTGRVMRLAPMTTKPTSFKDESGSWTGSFVELWRHALKSFNGTRIEIADPIVSQESINQINGSYWTSCVHDVGIGRLDACIGDFWMTEARLTISNFLPSLYDQPQYFLISVKENESLGEILWKPFAPLEPQTWIVIVGFLAVSGLALYWAERADNGDDFPPEEPAAAHVCLSLYYGIAAMFGGTTVTSKTDAGKVISLGLGFFVLIATCTYTATLASILVTSSLSGSVASFDEAIAANYRICTDAGMGSRLLKVYPVLGSKGLLLMDGIQDRCPGMAHRGEAEGIIFSPPAVERMHSGLFAENECGEGSEHSGDEATCPKGEGGGVDLARDCKIRRVGDAPLFISVSMPISADLQHALGWAFTNQIEKGTLNELQKQFLSESYASKNVCPASTSFDKSAALPVSALLGSLLIAGFCVLCGLFMATVSMIRKRRAAGTDGSNLGQTSV